MFEPRTLIFFKPFYFKNNNTPQDKFFISLHWEKGKGILASLPSSQDHIPSDFENQRGCIEIPSADFNCFLLTPEDEITEEGFKFEKKTIIYGPLIDFYEESFFDKYPFENIDYFIKGKLSEKLYKKIIACLKNSKSVKKRYKKILETL